MFDDDDDEEEEEEEREELPISKQLKVKGPSLEQLQSLSNWTE